MRENSFLDEGFAKRPTCIYCGGNTYGRPCIYSPHKTHIIYAEHNKCIYCGSTSLGTGCMYNPYGKIHIRGQEFLNRVLEQVKNSSVLSYLYENLKLSTNESSYKSPLDRFYKRIATTISKNAEPILESLAISSKPTYENLSDEQKSEVVMMKERISEQISDLKQSLIYTNSILPPEIVESILIDAILVDDQES